MQKIILIVIIITLVLGCGSKIENKDNDSITTEKNDFLQGLTALGLTVLEPQDYDSFLKNLFDAGKVPFYTEEGELIPLSERMNIISSGNYVATIYVDKKKEIKLWVVRPQTVEEKRKSADTNSISKKPSKLIGQDAIPFLVKNILGNEYSLKKQKGKIIVMNFWFLGCYPCLQEIPELNKLVENYKGKEVLFLGFALDKKDKLDSYLKKNPFNYIIIPESKLTSDSYQVKLFPTHVIIDKSFKIKYYFSGAIKPNEKNNLKKEIDQLLTN